MANVVTIPSRLYQVGTLNRNFNMNNSNTKELRLTMSTSGWPTPGEVVSIEVFFPDGTSAGKVGFSGGTLNRQGLAQCSYGIRNRDRLTGQLLNLPQGSYSFNTVVSQDFTSQVTIERF